MYVHFFKRVFDIFFSICALPLLIIAFFIFGPLIYFEDKSNIFYKANRIAKGGKQFYMFKFRTMKLDAPDIRLEDGSTYNNIDDFRLTKIGKFLRKNSIDELPQIINVFLGEMSLIGPRPDPIDWLERYTEEQRIILNVRPGITGYNQAFFRNNADGKMKLVNDVYYANNISFLLDIKIFCKTIKTVINKENINVNFERK